MPKSRRRNQAIPATSGAVTTDSQDAVTAPEFENESTSLPLEGSSPTNGDGADTPAPLEATADIPKVAASTAPTLRSISNDVTLELALYALIFIAALLFRLVNLDARPLAPSEAQTAVAAWQFLNGKPVGAFLSPFLFTLNWLAFFLFGATDLSARFFPAALSAALVFVPTLARKALGKTGALIAALLIAFSPSLNFFGRNLSGADLAVGGSLSALILLWQYLDTKTTRPLYLGAFLAGLSLTADGTAFPILIAGGIYLVAVWALARRGEAAANDETQEEISLGKTLEKPLVRAVILFAVTYLLFATTFLLNRDGLGVAFNLLGSWLSGFSSVGQFASPLNWLIVYEPLPLIFGLAGLVLVFTLRQGEAVDLGILRLISIVALAVFLSYTFAGTKSPSVVTASALPMMLLGGWFIGNLLERAAEDIRLSGGYRTVLSGELPVFAMLMILSVLVYLQFVTFLQQTRFVSVLDGVSRLLSGNAGDTSVLVAAITLALITLVLLGVFIGLSILLVGAARTTTLVAFAILVLLSFGMLRAIWQLNFSADEPVRELLTPSETTIQMRDLVSDLEWNSQWQQGDPRVIQLVADTALGDTGRWYLRNFVNVQWTSNMASVTGAEAVITDATTPPPGNWRGQRYRINVDWQPANFAGLDLWKWFVFRQGGAEAWTSTMLWLPTEQQQQ